VTFGFAELQGGGSRVRIVPALGGKISVLEIAGRQWLWTNDAIEPREPVDGASYIETADTGGYDECFPTVAPCWLPGNARAFGGVSLPDHGELWSMRAEVSVETGADGQAATAVWEGKRMPYRFTRTVRVTPAGQVVFHYSVLNTGREPVPFLWSSHPLLPLTDQTWLDLPAGAMVRVDGKHGAVMHMAEDFRWPRVRLEKAIADLSWPATVAKQYACKLFVTMPSGTAVVAVEDGAARLEVTFDSAEVPTVGVWINRRGWSPSRKIKPYLNLGFEPCIGSPDSLATALGPWDGAQWLQPGATRSWTLTWRSATPRADRISKR
jgi:galactose mutarotase-like enzyme